MKGWPGHPINKNYSINPFLAIFLRTENGHIMLRKKEKKERYLLFIKALFWNLRKFKEILRKRFNRTMKIDIVAEK
jgi:hypothetical protein